MTHHVVRVAPGPAGALAGRLRPEPWGSVGRRLCSEAEAGGRPQEGEGQDAVSNCGPCSLLLSPQCDSARNLEWLKTVKESHGSVELSSLTLATAINQRGMYVIHAPKGGQKVSGPHPSVQLPPVCRLLPVQGLCPQESDFSPVLFTDLPRHGSALGPSWEPWQPRGATGVLFRGAEGAFEQVDADVWQEGS